MADRNDCYPDAGLVCEGVDDVKMWLCRDKSGYGTYFVVPSKPAPRDADWFFGGDGFLEIESDIFESEFPNQALPLGGGPVQVDMLLKDLPND